MKSPAVKIFVQEKKDRRFLVDFLCNTNSESLLQDYYRLPHGFFIYFVDQKYLGNAGREFKEFIKNTCWVLIHDGKQNSLPTICKTAKHRISWSQLKYSSQKELLLIFEKCFNANGASQTLDENALIEIQCLNKSFKVLKSEQVYLFTNIDRHTYVFYQLEKGRIRKEIIQNSISFMEKKLQGQNFFRTHKNFLINVNKLEKRQSINSQKISLGLNVSAKLSRNRQNEFIQFLENI